MAKKNLRETLKREIEAAGGAVPPMGSNPSISDLKILKREAEAESKAEEAKEAKKSKTLREQMKDQRAEEQNIITESAFDIAEEDKTEWKKPELPEATKRIKPAGKFVPTPLSPTIKTIAQATTEPKPLDKIKELAATKPEPETKKDPSISKAVMSTDKSKLAPIFNKKATPEMKAKSIDKIEEGGWGGLSEENKQIISDARDEVRYKQGLLDDMSKEDKKSIAWSELGEKLGHALTQIGAGYYGLKHNVDMSGVKFSATDWNKKLDRIQADIDRQQGALNKESDAINKNEAKKEDRGFSEFQQKRANNLKIELQDLMNKAQDSRQDKKIAADRTNTNARIAASKGKGGDKEGKKEMAESRKDSLKLQSKDLSTLAKKNLNMDKAIGTMATLPDLNNAETVKANKLINSWVGGEIIADMQAVRLKALAEGRKGQGWWASWSDPEVTPDIDVMRGYLKESKANYAREANRRSRGGNLHGQAFVDFETTYRKDRIKEKILEKRAGK